MLELRNISAGYDGHPVLRNVSLTVPDEAVVALIGPNGAGKTTLLRVATGLLRPTSGQILLDGVDITLWSADRRAREGICHVPEGRGIFPTLSVADNLRLQSPPAGERRAPAIAGRAFPKLAQRLGQRAGTMSGGEQQMLAMAHAYVSRPEVVLLDEVSMGLAPNIVDEIFESLGELARRGASLLIVEQFVQRALALADYAFVLRKGRIDFAGEPGQFGDEAITAAYLGDG